MLQGERLKNPKVEKVLLQRILPNVLKPGRYLGNEINNIHKNPEKVKARIVLAFPDVYEIGMSYVGFQILYHILNKEPDFWAERVFAPWPDMEEQLRKHKLPLFSLESFTPLKAFDVIGFTLQYELTYTNILNMLDLGGVTVLASEREQSEPFVIAGGPCSCNPEPLADFIDAFLIGDGEEAAVEIVRTIQQGRQQGKTRNEILFDLTQIRGVYVPAFYRAQYDQNQRLTGVQPVHPEVPAVIRNRLIQNLKPEYYPTKPVVPLIEVTHDRLSVEVMRGCTEGCRYCNAGMIYRPVRERDEKQILQHMQEGLANSGYSEVSFLSLSISDYSKLNDLMIESRNVLQDDQVNVSFPSMRLDSFNEAIADFVSQVRKSGFTFAPEAGSQRLRNVINKNISEEDLFQSVEIALKNGWKLIKFYFMIGLPTETDEDVLAIADLMIRLARMSRRYGRVQFNVSISPFSPKAHTPFQWERQNSIDEIWHKVDLLKYRLKRESRVRLTWRDPKVSFLEGILGRADRRMGRVLYQAWQQGAKFDGWAEYFDFERWLNILKEHGYTPEQLIAEIPEDAVLPWDHVDKGITKRFLLKERHKAYQEQVSWDCKSEKCLACGLQRKGLFAELVDCYKKDRSLTPEKQRTRPVKKEQVSAEEAPAVQRFRVQFKKEGYASFLSHLDLVRVIERAFRRANIPLSYSEGFNPRPKISFGQPLALGIQSKAEFFDVEIKTTDNLDLKNAVNPFLPEGLKFVHVVPIKNKVTSLSSAIDLAEYEIVFKESEYRYPEVDRALQRLRRAASIDIQKRVKGRLKTVNIRPFIESVHRRGNRIIIRTRTIDRRSVRIDDLARVIFNRKQPVKIVRKRQLIRSGSKEQTPLEILT